MDDDDLNEWSLANIMTAWAKLQNKTCRTSCSRACSTSQADPLGTRAWNQPPWNKVPWNKLARPCLKELESPTHKAYGKCALYLGVCIPHTSYS